VTSPDASRSDGRTRVRPSGLRGLVRGGAFIAGAMAVMNVSTYAFTVVAARLLGPVQYGALAAVMGLLLVLSVLSLGLQATGARRVAATPRDRARIEQDLLRTTYWCAADLAALTLAAAPAVASALDLGSWVPAALLAASVLPVTVMGGQAGILQGERRWLPLALVYLAVGVGRLVLGTGALLVERTSTAGLVGVALGAVLPVVVGWWALRTPAAPERPTTSTSVPGGGVEAHRHSVLRETAQNSQALLAFFALSNADVVVARVVLDAHQSGLYAAGLILTKAVLFLPQFVIVIAFPSMAAADRRHRHFGKALAVVLAMGAAVTVGTMVLSGLAVVFVGGAEYAGIEDLLWAFAAVGTLLALIQILVYEVVARQRPRAVLLVWAALACVVGLGTLATTPAALVSVVAVVDLCLLAALALWSSRVTPDRPVAPLRS
jgi:O-antigen/teichoic acid export membrane protein